MILTEISNEDICVFFVSRFNNTITRLVIHTIIKFRKSVTSCFVIHNYFAVFISAEASIQSCDGIICLVNCC